MQFNGQPPADVFRRHVAPGGQGNGDIPPALVQSAGKLVGRIIRNISVYHQSGGRHHGFDVPPHDAAIKGGGNDTGGQPVFFRHRGQNILIHIKDADRPGFDQFGIDKGFPRAHPGVYVELIFRQHGLGFRGFQMVDAAAPFLDALFVYAVFFQHPAGKEFGVAAHNSGSHADGNFLFRDFAQ